MSDSPTFRLLGSGCDGAHKVLWRHENLPAVDKLQCGEITEDLVGGGVGADSILVANDLHECLVCWIFKVCLCLDFIIFILYFVTSNKQNAFVKVQVMTTAYH